MVINKAILGEGKVIVMTDVLNGGSSSIYIPLAAIEKSTLDLPCAYIGCLTHGYFFQIAIIPVLNVKKMLKPFDDFYVAIAK